VAKIATSLSYLATARQGQIDAVTLDVYCTELKAFPIDEVMAAVKDLARTPREPGETAMPDLGTVLAAVKYAGRFRIVQEAEREREREERHRTEHPEAYVSVRDIFAEVMARKGITQREVTAAHDTKIAAVGA
jgi:hypothetical protein